MDSIENRNGRRHTTIILVAVAVASLSIGASFGYLIGYSGLMTSIDDLERQVLTLQQQISGLEATQNVTYSNISYLWGENASLSLIYDEVKESVVTIRGIVPQRDFWGRIYYTQVQGTGFVSEFGGQTIVITNYHVVQSAVNISVTFTSGSGYAAEAIGWDPYADLAVLSTDAPSEEYNPLEIVSSSTLEVGDYVIAVGNPYGLAGSMTTGIVSALGRTITEDLTGAYPIANVIQTTTPLNPGNSGGPLLNYQGQVVGITTAIISDSQGLGFAIPSNTILREIEALVLNASYNQHPWLGASGTSMTYEISQAMNMNVTRGLLITKVTSRGPADNAGLRAGTTQATVAGERITVGGDIIVAVDGTAVNNLDDLSTYLEEHTKGGQMITLAIVRNNQVMNVTLALGTQAPVSP